MSKQNIFTDEVISYLEVIIKVSELPEVVENSKVLLSELQINQNSELSEKQFQEFETIKDAYLEEQRQWAEKQGFTVRKSSYAE